jgi:hypothetical protein
MPISEHPSGYRPEGDEPLPPNVLPPDLAAFLKDQEIACLTHATDKGTAFIMKLPGAEIQSVRGRVPIGLRQELYAHPSAPVIRMVFTIFDQPETPLAVETFINVADEQQRADFVALGSQDELILLFYDETVSHQLTKVVPYTDGGTTAQLLDTADRLLRNIPAQQLDFDAAKAAVMATTSM